VKEEVQEPEEIIYGDVNGDGKVTGLDLVALARYLEGLEDIKNLKAADVNLDGEVDKNDELLLSKYLVGEIASLPVKEEVQEPETNTQQSDNTATSYTYDTSAFKAIKASEIKNASKSETIVVLIARQGCSYCSYYAPVITKVAKDFGITVRYIDLATIVDFSQRLITDEEAYDTLSNLQGSGEWKDFAKNNITGTPLTLIIKNNKVVGGIGGYTEADGVETAFKAAGLKK
jgi:thiol-disulfide isomerase/thioredoxin